MTALGVQRAEGASTWGSLIGVPDEMLTELDRRESGYTRVAVSAMTPRGERLSGYTYVPKSPAAPSADAPIAQSYVDVALSGFLSLGPEFAERFVVETAGWSSHWVNDRLQPRYPVDERQHSEVTLDALLERGQATYFRRRRLVS